MPASNLAKTPFHCPRCGKLKLRRDGTPHKCSPPGAAVWQPAATAPKTRVILADTGYPWPQVCLWDAEAGKWAVATLNVEDQNAAKESQNVWWETEYESAILGWAELPTKINRP